MRKLLIPPLLFLLTSCATNSQYSEVIGDQGLMLISHSGAELQNTYVKTKPSAARACSETDVDFSKTKSSGVNFGVGMAGTADNVGAESGQGALTLGGRDPAVLMARELMFRACELTLNINADPRLALKIYAGTLDAVIKIAKYQNLTGTTSTSAAAPQLAALPVQKSSTSSTSTAPASVASSTQKTVDDPFNWDYNWDYTDNADTIDPAHP